MQRKPVIQRDWGTELIEHILYPIAIILMPLFLLSLMIFFVTKAFTEGVNPGIRSFCSVLLPLMALTFLVKFRREILGKANLAPSGLTFIVTLAVGLAIMRAVSFAPHVPLRELVLSGTFSVLVFSYVLLDRDKSMSYYFGTILGALVYVVLWGFPKV